MTRQKTKSKFGLLIAVFLIVVGTGIVLFPFASHWVTAKAQQQVGEQYSLVANRTSEMLFRSAVHANEVGDKLSAKTTITLNGVDPIARLRVPTIDVDLPVYPTASKKDLLRGAGHLEGTHLPVGGIGTHSAITAHSGMPTKRMFDQINRLTKGDYMVVEVLGHHLVYEVIRIVVDSPADGTKHLGTRANDDLLTLVTCTPYGVNTHRLMVTGQRVTVDHTKVLNVSKKRRPPWLLLGGASVLAISTAAYMLKIRKSPDTKPGSPIFCEAEF